MKKVDLGRYSNAWYRPGGIIKRVMWYIVNALFIKSIIPYPSFFKTALLRLFGCKTGRKIIIKPCVNIKYPWFLTIGNNVWMGEATWIDNMAPVVIGDNVCISQAAYIITNNHNYKKDTFDLMISPITIEEGVWIGARSTICPGVNLKSHSVISVGAVVTTDTEPYKIYKGVPAAAVKDRIIE